MHLKKNRKKKFFSGEHDFSGRDHLKQKNQKYSVSFKDSSGIDVEFFCSSCSKNFWCMFKAKKPKTKKKGGV